MELEEITQRIIRITEEHFRDKAKKIDRSTTAADIPAWNSLQHVMLIARIEEAFMIKFDLLQMIDMKSIEDISKKAFELIDSR